MARILSNTLYQLKKELPILEDTITILGKYLILDNTRSPTKYLPIFKLLGKLCKVKLYKTQSLEGYKLLVVGTNLNIGLFGKWLLGIINATEKDVKLYRGKEKGNKKRTLHLREAIAKYRIEQVDKAVAWLHKLLSQITNTVAYEALMGLKISKYCKDQIKHKNLKKAINGGY